MSAQAQCLPAQSTYSLAFDVPNAEAFRRRVSTHLANDWGIRVPEGRPAHMSVHHGVAQSASTARRLADRLHAEVEKGVFAPVNVMFGDIGVIMDTNSICLEVRDDETVELRRRLADVLCETGYQLGSAPVPMPCVTLAAGLSVDEDTVEHLRREIANLRRRPWGTFSLHELVLYERVKEGPSRWDYGHRIRLVS